MSLREILSGPVEAAARGLVGCRLAHDGVILRITEVEAYGGPEDGASHARHGRTARNRAMWGPPGRAYLFFCYGAHWMLNVVTAPEGEAAAVLIRSAEVEVGLERVCERRKRPPSPDLCAGPGKVAQTLALDRAFDAHDLLAPGGLELRPGEPRGPLLSGPRIGIAYAPEPDRLRPWRFADGGSMSLTHVSALKTQDPGPKTPYTIPPQGSRAREAARG